MDMIKTVSNVLGGVCAVIGVWLVPLGIWFLRPAIKTKDRTSLIIAILVLALAVGSFIGAYVLFTQGIIKQAEMPTVR
jgi:hypothetical protein